MFFAGRNIPSGIFLISSLLLPLQTESIRRLPSVPTRQLRSNSSHAERSEAAPYNSSLFPLVFC